MLLMTATVLALVLANGPLAVHYQQLLDLPVGVSFGEYGIRKSLLHWVNDGLMALFFFVVGLELKREFIAGELADVRQAALPIIAALGGMAVPALFYFALNQHGLAARGWGIPMATDIAFAVGALALLAARVPRALITFLVALAIVDDLGAVAVIAVFYTADLAAGWLAAAAGIVLLLVGLNLAGVRRMLPYFLLATLLWYALLQSGVHATLAGVIGAFTVPTLARYDAAMFSARLKQMVARADAAYVADANVLTNDSLRAVLHSVENGVVAVQSPLQRMERLWHLPVAFLVVPTFALCNAGIAIDPATLADTLRHPVTLGVSAGLLLGKFIGISGACWLALRLGVARLPKDTRFSQIAGVSLLAGIGFTMSIFIAELAFADAPALLLMAKTGVLLTSAVSGALGFSWLWWLGRGTVHVRAV